MVFRPVTDKTRWEGLIASGWLLLIDLLLLHWVLQRPTDTLRFLLIVFITLSVPALLYLLYRTWGAFTLEYWIDRNAVTIRWANLRQVIPLQAIQQIIDGDGGADDEGNVESKASWSATWRYWPAPFVRRAQKTHPRTTLFATQPLADSLLLDTGKMRFAISPADPQAFLVALQERYRLGPSQLVVMEQIRLSTLERFLGKGQLGPLLLGLGLLGVLLLFGVLMVQFPELPNPLPVRYSRDGLPELVRDKEVLFRLPMIGLWAWIINGVWGLVMAWRRQPIGAYLLWGGTLVVHAFLFMALRGVLV